jgi:hypothetical protein
VSTLKAERAHICRVAALVLREVADGLNKDGHTVIDVDVLRLVADEFERRERAT